MGSFGDQSINLLASCTPVPSRYIGQGRDSKPSESGVKPYGKKSSGRSFRFPRVRAGTTEIPERRLTLANPSSWSKTTSHNSGTRFITWCFWNTTSQMPTPPSSGIALRCAERWFESLHTTFASRREILHPRLPQRSETGPSPTSSINRWGGERGARAESWSSVGDLWNPRIIRLGNGVQLILTKNPPEH